MRFIFWLLLTLAASAQTGNPWFLGLDGGVYTPDLHRVGLGTGSSLAVSGSYCYLIGQDQRVWMAGRDGNWQPLPGLAKGKKIVAGPTGELYLLGTDGGVYLRAGNNWKRQGLAVATDLAVSPSGQVFLIGTDAHIWSGINGQFTPFNALALGKKVGAGLDGSVYVIGMDDGVYRLLEGDLTRLGLATGKELAVGPEGQMALVGMDGGVYLYEGDWTRVGTGQALGVTWPW